MKKFIQIILAALAFAGMANAENKDLYFTVSKNNGLSSFPNKKTFRIPSFETSFAIDDIRLRFIDPPEDPNSTFGFYLERPIFIIDGIHLSTDEERTLTQLQEETEAFGIPSILKSMGYTPVLVQFTKTVTRSLQTNADALKKLLITLNSSSDIPFPNKQNDGFIVLGISQGGVIGRYAAYLYDIQRNANDTPIRMFASLDSPHQGAVMPRSLITSIDFWGNYGGSASADAFYNLLIGPGARDLLVYKTDSLGAPPITDDSRFLFSDYRKACEYDKFPAVLISQGQLKGSDPAHATTYYHLNRRAKKWGAVVGRAASTASYSEGNEVFSDNKLYEFNENEAKAKSWGETTYDFVQGSTYPFPKTLYWSLRQGMYDAMPDGMTTTVGHFFWKTTLTLNTAWDYDNLYQESSTFIPTASAMDLKKDGELAIRSDYAHTVKASDIDFENPGESSTGDAVFGVDPTHPRYNEAISGRHIESPVENGSISQNVLDGMQTDVWRILCEVANYDYDESAKQFRNPKLNGFFYPNTSCMDRTKIPSIIANGGITQTTKIPYARYTYNTEASEGDENVSFVLNAGWQKVAKFNTSEAAAGGSSFEIDIKVENPKSNWMKAELLVVRDSKGNGQIQLQEIDVPQDGYSHTLRWQLPNTDYSAFNYNWYQLVLNSNGANVTLSNPRIVLNTKESGELPPAIQSNMIYPNPNYSIMPWSSQVSIKEETYNNSDVLSAETKNRYDGFHIDLGEKVHMKDYNYLVVEFVPGTCQNTEIYFDSKDKGNSNLVNSGLQNSFAKKVLHLFGIIDTNTSTMHSYSASRLKVQATKAGETCKIKSIYLQQNY